MSSKKSTNNNLRKSLIYAGIIVAVLVVIYLFISKAHFGFTGYLWLIAALVLTLTELFTPTFFILPFGIGCLIACISNLLGLKFLAQVFVFVGASLICWVFLHFLLKSKGTKQEGTGLNGDGLVGSTAVVTEPINPPLKGRVYLQGNTWAASADFPIEKGKKVTVESLEGITVIVKEEK